MMAPRNVGVKCHRPQRKKTPPSLTQNPTASFATSTVWPNLTHRVAPFVRLA